MKDFDRLFIGALVAAALVISVVSLARAFEVGQTIRIAGYCKTSEAHSMHWAYAEVGDFQSAQAQLNELLEDGVCVVLDVPVPATTISKLGEIRSPVNPNMWAESWEVILEDGTTVWTSGMVWRY